MPRRRGQGGKPAAGSRLVAGRRLDSGFCAASRPSCFLFESLRPSRRREAGTPPAAPGRTAAPAGPAALCRARSQAASGRQVGRLPAAANWTRPVPLRPERPGAAAADLGRHLESAATNLRVAVAVMVTVTIDSFKQPGLLAQKKSFACEKGAVNLNERLLQTDFDRGSAVWRQSNLAIGVSRSSES